MDDQMPNRPNLGLSEDAMRQAVDLLEVALADEVTLYTKLRKYHWNVTGPQFMSLHELFEEQYTAIEALIDEVAERARTYGFGVIGTMPEFEEKARLGDTPGEIPSAEQMVRNLVSDHESLVRHLKKDADTAGSDLDDPGLEDFFIAALQSHQNMAWMLRSFIQSDGID